MMTAIPTPNNWRDLKPNEWCLKIARPDEEDRARIKRSIEIEGFRVDYPIALYREEDGALSILDGFTRHSVCVELDEAGNLKREPTFAEWSPGDPSEGPWLFALRTNNDRRQMTKSQVAAHAIDDPRAELAKDAARERQKAGGGDKKSPAAKSVTVPGTVTDSKPRSQKTAAADIARLAGTNVAAVEHCQRLKRDAPDLLEKVKRGEIGTTNATELLRLRKSDPESAERAERGEIPIRQTHKKAKESQQPKNVAESKKEQVNEQKEAASEPADYFGDERYACQTEIYTNVATRSDNPQPPSVKLNGADVPESAHKLSRYFDRNQTASLIYSMSRFWQPWLIDRVIQLLNQRKVENEKQKV